MKKLLCLVFVLVAVLALTFAVSAADAQNVAEYNYATIYNPDGTQRGDGKGLNGGEYADQLFDGNLEKGCYLNGAGCYIIIDLNAKLPGGYYVTDIAISHLGNTQYSVYYTNNGSTWNPVVENKQEKGTVTYAVNDYATQVKYVYVTAPSWVQALCEIQVFGIDPAEMSCAHPNLAAQPWVEIPGSATCTDYGYQKQVCPDCDAEFTRHTEEVPALGHDLSTNVTKPGTDISYGEGTIVCSRCDYAIDFKGEVDLTGDYYMDIFKSSKFVNVSVSSIADKWGASKVEFMFNNTWACGAYNGWFADWASHTDTYDDEEEYVIFDFKGDLDLTKIDIMVPNDPNATLRISTYDEVTGEYVVLKELATYDENLGTMQNSDGIRMTISMLGITADNLKFQVISPSLWSDGFQYYSMIIGELHVYGIAPGCGMDAANHECYYENFVGYYKEPTCVDAGIAIYQCACNAQTNIEVEPSEEFHNYVEVEGTRVDATCTEAGSYKGVCEYCQAEADIVVEADTENGHSYEETGRTDATCTTVGSIEYTCSACGATKSEEIALADHAYGEAVVVNPTCTEAGSSTKTCTVCGNAVVEEIAALNHTWVLDSYVTEPTCGAAGEANYVCSVCGETKTDVVAATGDHTLSEEFTVILNPTCEGSGAAQYVCTVCGKNVNKGLAALGHDFSVEVEGSRVNPECNKDGSVQMSCANGCGNTTTVVLPKSCTWLFVGYDEANAPTCDIEGIANYECIACGKTKTEKVYHRFLYFVEFVEGKAPTCTDYGYATYECLWCSERETRLVAPQHSYEITETVNATCTEVGSQTSVCSICGDTQVEELPANGHNQKWQYDETTATCTEAGVEKYGCWNCDAVIEVEVEAYGHQFSIVDGSIDLENHTVDKECSVCGVIEKVSSLGLEEDPIAIEVPGSFTASVSTWVYYSFVQSAEGYITFTFDTTNVNVMVKEVNGKYDTQYFWGGKETYTAEIFGDGSYVVAISTNDNSALDIAVETTYEEADVPGAGETADKAIMIEGANTAYTSTGTVWYYFEFVPMNATVSFTVEGEATVKYGTDAENLVEYTEAFVDADGYTKYYVVVESTEEVSLIVNVVEPVGTIDNALIITEGSNYGSYAGGWNTFYATYIPEANGVLTLTFDGVVIYVGTHPYMMQTPVTSGEAIEVTAGTQYWFGVSTEDQSAADFVIESAFEGEAIEPPTPDVEIGDKIGSIDVTTTDTYGWFDEYTYVADKAGQYTFFVPANLGLISKPVYDAYGAAEADFYENKAGAYVTVDLAEGEAYTFYVGALTKADWTIDVYYYTAAPVYAEGVLVDSYEGQGNVILTYTAPNAGNLFITIDADGEYTVSYTVNGEEKDDLAAVEAGDVVVITITTEGYVAVDAALELPHVCEFTVSERVESTCTTAGKVVYTCTCGETKEEALELAAHTEVEIPAVLATPSVTGMTAGIECSVCGTVIKAPVAINVTEMADTRDPNFRVYSASLTLQENISMNYRAVITAGYDVESAYMVFLFNGKEFIVTDKYLEESSGRYVFNFAETFPQLMSENIAAYLYAETAEGEYSMNKILNYSVQQYCIGQLKKNNAELTTLISNILTYGAMTQLYMNHNTDALITDIVAAEGYTLTPTAFPAEGLSGMDYQKITAATTEATTKWVSATLAMGSSTEIKLKFATADISGLKVKATMGEGENQIVKYYEGEDFIADGSNYVVYINHIRSYEFNEKVTFTFERDGAQVGSTLEYSINTFIQRNYTKGDENTKNLIKAMYIYGLSVENYWK